MEKIKNVLICGIGAIGGYYASKIFDLQKHTLKVLVDKSRLDRYQKEPRVINEKEYNFDYILPEETDYKADLIIIATKSNGLKDSIKNIKNFVKDDTIIFSFLNGVSSEHKLEKVYGEDKLLYSYLIGHTFFRNGRSINHDGHAKIIFGSKFKDDTKVERAKAFFDEIGVPYEIPGDIIQSQWLKFAFNCCVNQISAITRMNFGEIKQSQKSLDIMKTICTEIQTVAEKVGVSTSVDFYKHSLESLDIMIPEGKTSMLQDIESGRKPETDLFGHTVNKLGIKYGIDTPYNRLLADMIDIVAGNE